MAALDYTVKESPKAKHVRLKLTAEEGLSVIVPKGFDHTRIPAILESKKAWLDDALERTERSRKFFAPRPQPYLPERLDLDAIGQTWSVRYEMADGTLRLVQVPDRFHLIFRADRCDRSAVIKRLTEWLRVQCKTELIPLAGELAERHEFSINSVMIRNQRTRWGSCSAKKNISLNMKLLFIPPDLVRYVILHELCHLRELNHTRRFWRLLESVEPQYRVLDARLRESWKRVPQWLFTQEKELPAEGAIAFQNEFR